MSKPNETHCIIARHDLTGHIPAAARVIAKATGQVVFDITRGLRDTSGFLASGLTQDQADTIVAGLSQAGVRAFALPETKVVYFPDPVFLETARLGGTELDVADLRDKKNVRAGKVAVPYASIVFLVTACVRTEEVKRVVEHDSALTSRHVGAGYALGGAFGAVAAAAESHTTVRHEGRLKYDHLLDIYAVEPAHHLRLNASTFNFYETGLEMQPTSIANLAQFIEHFAVKCGRAHIDPSIKHILDGNPQTNLTFNSPDQYDAYLSWRIQLLYNPEAQQG